ncbi:MAG: cell division protein ZapE [Rhodanobacteraceae bacterium]
MTDPTAVAARAGPPSSRYQAGVAAGRWQSDPAQLQVLAPLDRVWTEVTERADAGFWGSILQHLNAETPRGVYLWGSVGRGKTVLLDLLFESIPTGLAERVHFHRFMRSVHARLTELAGKRDPLKQVAARISAHTRLLCLDEFFVSDIGDAMILANLLRELFVRGVTLVTTSNTRPDLLYHDGLQRERFVSAIQLIESACEVVALESPRDWRLRALKQAPTYQTPPGDAAERVMADIFGRVAGGPVRCNVALDLNDRIVVAKCATEGSVWFDFGTLCEGPRAVADYIELARDYHTTLVSNVPRFTPLNEDAARRFIELVDEFYDRAVNLVLSAAAPVVELYAGERLSVPFARTQSRLIEMQSEEYLARAHRA